MTGVTIAEQVAAMAAATAGQPPREVMDVMAREQGWGRIVNVSSGAAADPAAMVRGNTYVTTKAALEAHTLNLAAELAGSGVTANVYRPGSVDTAMQAWIRAQPPEKIGAALHERFVRSYQDGSLITPEQSARSLMQHLASDATGQIWNADSNRPAE